MKKRWNLLRIIEALMRSKTAPCHEGFVAAAIQKICRDEGLALEIDKFGNLLVTLNTTPKTTPLILAAHMDHPGFDILKLSNGTTLQAKFLGGVGDLYFKTGAIVSLQPGNIPGTLNKIISLKDRTFELESFFPLLDAPEFAVWDLEEFRYENGLIHGRVCDDLIGVAAILAVMIELKRSGKRAYVIGAISRAEEVGFHGALALVKSGKLPKKGLIISLETSREMPPVKMGEGVIVRVGDRSSIFNSSFTRYLVEVGNLVAAKSKGFKFQRALMSGGSCEATAYQEYGFTTAGVCVALGNYHNCGPNEEIAAEYVSYSDAQSMVQLLIAAANQMPQMEKITAKLPERLEKLAQKALKELVKRPLIPTERE